MNSLLSAIFVAIGGVFVIALGIAILTFAIRGPVWCGPNESAAECFRSWLVAIVPVFALAGAVVAAYFAFGQMRAAQHQLKQMQEQTSLARQQFEATQRPWIEVSLDQPEIQAMDDDDRVALRLSLKNIGTQPALHVLAQNVDGIAEQKPTDYAPDWGSPTNMMLRLSMDSHRKAPARRGFTIFPAQSLADPGKHLFYVSGGKGWTAAEAKIGVLVRYFGSGSDEMHFTPAVFYISVKRDADGSIAHIKIEQDFDAIPPT